MKDYGMIELWDDRAVQVVPNTGIRIQDYVEEKVRKRDVRSATNDYYPKKEQPKGREPFRKFFK